MTIDVYSATGAKKGTATLPKELFEATINDGLMHQALVRQQSNRRAAIAHVKTRGEVQGSTRKLYQQKGTGRARRGPANSPLLRSGGKAFGPRKVANFEKDMPKKMRRAALASCLSLQAKNKKIIGLESYPETIKTKEVVAMLSKMPVDLGRRILVVTPDSHASLALSVRNVPGVRIINAAYLNPEDVLVSHHIIFMVDALKKAEEVFVKETKAEKKEAPKKAAPKKETKKKVTSDKK